MKKFIVRLSLLLSLLGCQPEYANAPEVCLLVYSELGQLIEGDRKELDEGKITQQQFNDRVRRREDGTLGICLIALIKRKQSGNF